MVMSVDKLPRDPITAVMSIMLTVWDYGGNTFGNCLIDVPYVDISDNFHIHLKYIYIYSNPYRS